MKKIALLVFSLFLFAQALTVEQAFAQDNQKGPVITFAKGNHDFGDIKQGDKVEHVFKFENTGTEPLILSNVSTTCGCTASNWPREPIAPGGSGEIKITFDSAGKSGMQTKVATIYSNAVNAQEKIKITTNILPKSINK
jgi:hypothetical protein